jgi:hypothetical protein
MTWGDLVDSPPWERSKSGSLPAVNIPITSRDDPSDDDDLLEDDTLRSRITPSRALRTVAYGSAALWIVTVVVGAWNSSRLFNESGPSFGQSFQQAQRIQAVLSVVIGAWGYLLVAILAFAAASWLKASTTEMP